MRRADSWVTGGHSCAVYGYLKEGLDHRQQHGLAERTRHIDAYVGHGCVVELPQEASLVGNDAPTLDELIEGGGTYTEQGRLLFRQVFSLDQSG